MKTDYLLQALASDIGSEVHLPAFADLLLRLDPAAQVQPIHRGLNVRLPFRPELLPAAESWAASISGVHVREFFVRTFTRAECAGAPLCELLFANCYLVPEPKRFESCAECSGNIEVSTGRHPTRVDFKHGIGAFSGALYLSNASAEVISASGLTGFTLRPWSNNPRYWQLQPTQLINEVLAEGQNAIGVTGRCCPRCGRPGLRYNIGPPVVRGSDYGGGDFVALKFMDFVHVAFSQAAARFLTSRFRGVRYWQPIWISSEEGA